MRILTVYSLTYWTLRVALLPVTIVGPGSVHLGGAPSLGYEGLPDTGVVHCPVVIKGEDTGRPIDP